METKKKKPEIPHILRILGERFTVKQVPDLMDEDHGYELDGLQTGHRISLNASQDSSRRWRALLHESLHGALYVTGLSASLSDELEESIVQTLETHFVQFLRQHGESMIEAIRGDT